MKHVLSLIISCVALVVVNFTYRELYSPPPKVEAIAFVNE